MTNIKQALRDAAVWQQHAARKWQAAQEMTRDDRQRRMLREDASRHYAMARRFLWLAIDGEYREEG